MPKIKNWSVKPRPLWQLTEKEKSETRKIQADTDAVYLDRQVLKSTEVRSSRFGGDTYSSETVLSAEDSSVDPVNPADQVNVTPNANVTVSPTTVGGEGTSDIQKEAMNGAQISSLVDVVKTAARGEISRESARAVIALAFQLSAKDADTILGPEGFVPTKSQPSDNQTTEVKPIT